jgi:hypothetical protein
MFLRSFITCTDRLCAGILVPISQECADAADAMTCKSETGESFHNQRTPVMSVARPGTWVLSAQ